MAKISAIEITKLLFDEGAAPSTPASTNVALYAKADGLLYSMDDAGAETLVSGGGVSSAVSLLGYASKTSTQAGITSEVDVTGLSVAVTAGTGRIIRIETHIRLRVAQSGGSLAASRGICVIKESTTQLGFALDSATVASSTIDGRLSASGHTIIEPSSGSHTYKVMAQAIGTGASVDIEASATGPCFIAVYDCGPA